MSDDGVLLKNVRHPRPPEFIEGLCRAICVADKVDPDAIGYGHGDRMPKDTQYPLWQARLKQAEAAADFVFAWIDTHDQA